MESKKLPETFRLHTGNINNIGQLKVKRYANSADELRACLAFQFQSNADHFVLQKNETITLKQNDEFLYDRNDLKITLKLFMSDFRATEIEECLVATSSQLQVDTIEQLIVAFPEIDLVAEESDEAEVSRWLSKVLPLWRQLEKLVGDGFLAAIGVADLQLPALRALYKEADVKPCINHFNIENCCVVPPELQTFAKEHDIQLLTHNDPCPFPTTEMFESICSSQKHNIAWEKTHKPTWVARYTIWVRRRSILGAKGYIVQFERVP
ncbi:hypothetical protein AB6A40_001702 [Gnathostoma spinigerum]|uniref:GCS light chain n=1 Tax=Gnathostoma spinigerum TaxID=75299 RepID=A0ABD6E4R9_9BILA